MLHIHIVTVVLRPHADDVTHIVSLIDIKDRLRWRSLTTVHSAPSTFLGSYTGVSREFFIASSNNLQPARFSGTDGGDVNTWLRLLEDFSKDSRMD